MTEQPKVDGDNPNPQVPSPTLETVPEPDYKTKFSESSKEALRLLEENKAKEAALAEKDAEIARLAALANGGSHTDPTDPLFPGFENLDDDAKKNLLAYTDSIRKSVTDGVYKDPAIAFAKDTYNEKKWDSAFDKVIAEFPDLNTSREDFKSKYYNKNNVPDNIESILKDLSKVYLFDKAKEIGAKEALDNAARIEVERANGGDKTPTTGRSLSDWQRLAIENPAKFASQAKQFNEDLKSGKLK